MVRRVVVVVLVVVSVGLFTGYFREDTAGPLHGAQADVGGVIAPLQSFASKAVQPVRDGWGWLTGLVDARDRAARYKRENDRLRAQVIEASDNTVRLAEAERLAGIRSELPGGYKRVLADVIGASTSSWYPKVRVDVGTADGVVVNAPVVAAGDGPDGPRPELVGVVTGASEHAADVSFITERGTAVGAYVLDDQSPPGMLTAIEDGQMLLRNVAREFRVRRGDVVLTSGFNDPGLPSIYPRGIPVGSVQSVGRQESDDFQSIQVEPFSEGRTLHRVVVLAPVSAEALRRARG